MSLGKQKHLIFCPNRVILWETTANTTKHFCCICRNNLASFSICLFLLRTSYTFLCHFCFPKGFVLSNHFYIFLVVIFKQFSSPPTFFPTSQVPEGLVKLLLHKHQVSLIHACKIVIPFMLKMQNLLLSVCALSLADGCYHHSDLSHLLFGNLVSPAKMDSSICIQS